MEDNTQDEQQVEFNSRIDLTKLQDSVTKVKAELGKVIIGQQEMIELLIVSILANGHSLIEGVPGVAKTVTAKLLAKTMNVDFSRIQFTPDLMPSDILGTSIFNVKTSEFEFKKGPIFSNIILIDEINRAPAKTQAALFEAMAERQITIDGNEFDMQPPFLVFATQNPVEQEGTYRLPEAQLDRFLFKINVHYPTLEEEVQILENKHHQKNNNVESLIDAILSAEQIAAYQKVIKDIVVEDNLLKYIAAIVNNTRTNANLYLGASPRASIAILDASKAVAAINGRDFITPDDIKKVVSPILCHRIILTPEREMEGYTAEKMIKDLIQTIEIPR
ncbi:MAG: MoxR family ATPase [Maribacter dokdonensis]|uniref:MoxR-like ATPase n=1 Tax=Maribacter dokdonensis TaxID=320912 RepID=A0A1H4J448_9FLAO|nr:MULTISPECIES: MoxR family ATPase [Maribacter]APA63344.1 magnesium chelatase [Maribacter sp. 1_2014MBL_MicDiv]MBU2902827.1 MoxR family ATPase [Maribacter dokdonensis]PHN93139.1 MoxR family ATPase [Maribacter sp. 6B07]SEB40845.1 MoxR-like ATPase [Maribacter dokdonensis]|tara:strand:+ start:291 stop:1289 length:999 start_codon:yes stop_codon:yes gene_type:complete